MMNRIPACMIGGGIGSLIGSSHRLGAKHSGYFELVAGAFSRNKELTQELGTYLNLSNLCCYEHWQDMIAAESSKLDGARVVIVASPDPQHYEQCLYALEHNIHVICDKPITITAGQALHLRHIAQEKNLLCGVTYTHNGNPAFMALKKIVQSGRLGNLRMLRGHLFAKWAMQYIEKDPSHSMHKQAWRLKMEYGEAGAISDIGSHVYQYMHDISGIRPTSLIADLGIMVPHRTSDDTANILFKYDTYPYNIGVTGVLSVSLAMTSTNENMSIEILGDNGGAKVYMDHGSSKFYLITNIEDIPGKQEFLGDMRHVTEYSDTGITRDSLQMFSNIYQDFGRAIIEEQCNNFNMFPSIHQGYEAMVFIEAALRSSKTCKWLDLIYE